MATQSPPEFKSLIYLIEYNVNTIGIAFNHLPWGSKRNVNQHTEYIRDLNSGGDCVAMII
jgi:hypothetical protein